MPKPLAAGPGWRRFSRGFRLSRTRSLMPRGSLRRIGQPTAPATFHRCRDSSNSTAWGWRSSWRCRCARRARPSANRGEIRDAFRADAGRREPTVRRNGCGTSAGFGNELPSGQREQGQLTARCRSGSIKSRYARVVRNNRTNWNRIAACPISADGQSRRAE